MKLFSLKFLSAAVVVAMLIPALTLSAQEKPTFEELMVEAGEHFRDQEIDKTLELIRKARKLYPDKLQASFALIQVLEQAGMEAAKEDRKAANKFFYESAEVAESLLGNKNVPPQATPLIAGAIYNKACSLAVEGKGDEAVKVLVQAFEVGFDDVATAKADSDFDSISKEKAFKEALVKGEAIVKKRRAEALAKKVKQLKKEIAEFESFDFDFELKSSEGKDVKLSDFDGKFLIVDFWGTWCGPCIMEIPHFIKLKNKYGKDGLEVIGIAYERTDDEEKAADLVQKFLERRKVNYKSLIGDEDTSDQVDIEGYPTTLFIDKEGKVRFKVTGYHDYEILEAIVKEIMKDSMNR